MAKIGVGKQSRALIKSPTLLQVVIVVVYAIMLASFIYNVFLDQSGDDTSAWFNLVAFTLVSIPSFFLADRYYTGILIIIMCFYIGVEMVELTLNYGLNGDPYIFLIVWPIIIAAITVGRQGLLICTSYTLVLYITMYVLTSLGIIPAGKALDNAYLRAETGSAFVILLMLVALTLYYVAARGEQLTGNFNRSGYNEEQNNKTDEK